MGTPVTQHSFRGGEIAPSSTATRATRCTASRCRTCKNFLPIVARRPRQPAGNLRPGRAQEREVRFEAFVFSDAQAFVLEFTAGKVRFWTPAGQVLDGLGNALRGRDAYTADDLPYLKFAQEGDVVTITRDPLRAAGPDAHHEHELDLRRDEPLAAGGLRDGSDRQGALVGARSFDWDIGAAVSTSAIYDAG
jgi:hypothetical protein